MRNFSGCLILASIYLILSSIFTTSFCKSAMSFFELVFDGFWRFFVEFGILFRQDRLSCLVSAFCGPKARVFRRSGLAFSFPRIRSYHLRMLRNRICCWFCQTLRRIDPWLRACEYCFAYACRFCCGNGRYLLRGFMKIAQKRYKCPKCGKEYIGHPDLSRMDNSTKICPECGMKEAFYCFIKRESWDYVL